MKIKKYRAATMPEIMNQMRKELGKEAVILQSREVFEGGFLGMFKKKNIEVIAALDKEPVKKQHYKAKDDATKTNEPDVMKEIKYLRKMLEEQANKSEVFFESEYLFVYQYLLDQELDKDMSKKIVGEVKRKHQQNSIQPSLTRIKVDTMKEIQSQMSSFTEQSIERHSKQVIQFVGPTGVGKTTTIAKIAAAEMMNHHKKVAFITTDTYRIAAVEQLRTYAKILDVPLEVAYTPEDYHQAVKKFSDYDLIFVDTAGRNFLDSAYLAELQQSVDLTEKMQNYLVMSLTAKQNDLLLLLKQFNHVHIDGLIFTKLDETKQFGSLCTLPYIGRIRVAYLSNGQSVPDDLIKPNPLTISRLIMGDFDED